MGASQTLTVGSNGESGVSWSSILQWSSLPNYYRVVIAVKYVAAGQVGLTLTATTPSSTQT